MLSPDDFPTQLWRRAYDRVILQRQTRYYYGAPEGELELRVELQGYLRRARGAAAGLHVVLWLPGIPMAYEADIDVGIQRLGAALAP